LKAYANLSHSGASITDDCQLVEALGQRCAIVEGSALNIKITTQIDLKLAAAILPLLERPKRPGANHPYADAQEMWSTLPKLKPSDLFGA
jgi:2-C-methyl-D-erythritol 4-phosphate cytidylyltransferase